jgi:hypothetical protein
LRAGGTLRAGATILAILSAIAVLSVLTAIAVVAVLTVVAAPRTATARSQFGAVVELVGAGAQAEAAQRRHAQGNKKFLNSHFVFSTNGEARKRPKTQAEVLGKS